MNDSQPVSKDSFRRILSRNISFPLGLGALSAVLFLAWIAYLLSVLNGVEHSERVIGNANQVARLNSEMESSMRGYLVAGDESFLQPYELAISGFDSEVASLSAMVSDDPLQVTRLQHIIGLQQQWNEFAKEAIALRSSNLDYVALARTSRGKRLKEEIRQELAGFITREQRLLMERNEAARSTTIWSVLAYLLFTLGVSGLLAFRGRRELLGLSVNYDKVLTQQAGHAAQFQQQAWMRSGQTRLAEQMLGQPDMARLGHSAL
jgi:CHASE3 domain sensor protein